MFEIHVFQHAFTSVFIADTGLLTPAVRRIYDPCIYVVHGNTAVDEIRASEATEHKILNAALSA